MPLQRPSMSSTPAVPHSASASNVAATTTNVTPPLSPATTTPSSSEQSLLSSASSDSSDLSTPFQNLRIEDHASAKQRKDQILSGQEQTYEGQLRETDDSMFEMLTRESPRSTPCGTPLQQTRPALQHSHSSFIVRTPRSPTFERPALVHRNTSYSKRHASVDSPREVPFPPMHSFSQQLNSNDHQPCSQEAADFYREHMGKATSGLSSEQISDSCPSQRPTSPKAMDTSEENSSIPSSSKTSSPQHYQRRTNPSGSVPLQGGRPISAQEPTRTIYSPTPVRPSSGVDRSSTHSLPVPVYTPYHTLPSIVQSSQDESSASASTSSSALDSTSPTAQPPSASASSSRRPGYMTRDDTLPRYDSSGISSTSTKQASPATTSRPFSPTPSFVMDAESSYMPPPVPPTILTPPPPPAQDGQHHAPHEPFLAHASPRNPEIRVETSRREYKLVVRLPGYRRDSITLSTRRKRILHIVADSWEPGGGHLERRVSFGYDADLTQVRAEFDGEYLRVTVPRRITPMTYMEARLS